MPLLALPLLAVALPATASAAPTASAAGAKTNCLYLNGTGDTLMANLRTTERATGITYNCLETFTDAVANWTEWEHPWIDGPQYGFVEFVKASKARRVVISMNLIPASETDIPDPLGWEDSCGAGHFNSYAVTLAKQLVANGFGHSIIRLGKEMNGSWENDFIGTTATEQRDWAGCFAREVTAMRSVRGEAFQFDWNVNACVGDYKLAGFYPGDSYVNMVGVDSYDSFCDGGHPAPSGGAFHQLATEPDGLDAVVTFANEHHKPFSIPEWGTQLTSSGGLGDDPHYVTGIGNFVAHHDVAYQSYFDPARDGIIPLAAAFPLTLKAYKAAFKK